MWIVVLLDHVLAAHSPPFGQPVVIRHPTLDVQGAPHLEDGMWIVVLLDHVLNRSPPRLMLTTFCSENEISPDASFDDRPILPALGQILFLLPVVLLGSVLPCLIFKPRLDLLDVPLVVLLRPLLHVVDHSPGAVEHCAVAGEVVVIHIKLPVRAALALAPLSPVLICLMS